MSEESVSPDIFDCLIVGGGPAGLTAAIYLGRFHLDVVVVDAGQGRAASIPLTRNHAGFPDGIAGRELLVRMRAQAMKYGTTILDGEVEAIAREGDTFVARVGERVIRARSVLLATGVVNRRPAGMSDAVHDDAVARGLMRYCPICDGYEVTDKNVAVLGTGERGGNEARFLRSFTATVTLIAPDSAHDLNGSQRDMLAGDGIRLLDGPAAVTIGDQTIRVAIGERVDDFDTLYPALGSDIKSELAATLGAACSDEGCLLVDAHMRTDVAGLYAAGDVVKGLDQISHAMGEGGVAATTIRNDLAERQPLLR